MTTFQTHDLRKAFSIAAKASSAKHKDILGNVHLRCQHGVAWLTGTDGEIYVETMTVADGAIDCLLPVSRVSAILAEATSETVELSKDSGQLTIECGGRFVLQTGNPMEFPTAPMPDSNTTQVPGCELRSAIKKTVFCADEWSTRYQLNGVLFEAADDGLQLIATDGRRLSTAGPFGVFSAQWSCIIPARACRLLESAFGDDKNVAIAVGKNMLSFSDGNVNVHTPLLEGRYPDWRKVLAPEYDTFIELRAGTLASMVRQAAIASDDTTRAVDLKAEDGKLVINAKAADVGTSLVSTEVDYHGEPLAVSLDYRFLLDALKVVDGGSIATLHIADAQKPVLLRCESLKYTIMPMSRS